MNRIAIFGHLRGPVLLAACLLTSCTTPSERLSPATGDLFNGKNLEGWRAFLDDPAVGMKDVWSVQDGLLVCKGEPMGYLYTSDSYDNFKLLVEWRWAPGKKPGNSGVLLRINGPHQALPRCLEAQLQSGNAGDFYGFHGMKIDGRRARLRQVSGHKLAGDLIGVSKIKGNEHEPGQWNTYEIIADGPSLTARVNGELVNEAFDCEVVSGPIGLQSEGGEIHFRTIRLTPL